MNGRNVIHSLLSELLLCTDGSLVSIQDIALFADYLKLLKSREIKIKIIKKHV